MCGVAGFWHRDGRAADPAQLDAMCRLIAHRGPDDTGRWISEGLALGHLRLSIIDLSALGRQPMATPDGALRIVFNGEIYNYIELRHELETLGHQFESRTDTEVILHAWRAWGVRALTRFRGMWAFALWDSHANELVLARDRAGIKPLYWTETGATLAFGSEIKALAPVQRDRSPDVSVIRSLVIYQQRLDPRRTSFARIQAVAPGTILRVRAGGIREERWYDPEADEVAAPALHDPATLRRLLEESVELHLRSDVPVGACLSGGLDSSALVALAVGKTDQPLHTFSVVYPGTDHDERSYVADVCARFPQLRHHEVFPDGRDALDTIEKIVWHFEEPIWSESTYSWWNVMALVKEHGIKVVINGQGADELLAGYPYYYPSYLRQLAVRGSWPRFGRELRAESLHQSMSNTAMLRYLAGPVWPTWMRRATTAAGLTRSWRDDGLGPMLRERGDDGSGMARQGFWSLEKHLRRDFEVARLPMLLQAEDRFSMAHSIESRVPFLDAPLVAWARTLPAGAKLRDGVTKVVLRDAMRDTLPARVVDRPDKMGYPTPSAVWFRGPLSDAIGDRLASRSIGDLGLLNGPVLRRSFDAFRRGSGGMPQLWRWLSLQAWGEQFLGAA